MPILGMWLPLVKRFMKTIPYARSFAAEYPIHPAEDAVVLAFFHLDR